VFGASTPHALIGSYSAFKGDVICSAAFHIGRCWACRTTLWGSRSRFLLVHTLTRSSSLKPLSLLVDWI